MSDARRLVDAEVRALVRQRGIDPAAQRAEVRSIADAVVTAYEERALVATLPQLGDADEMIQDVVDAVAGFGPLQRYLDDPEVEEIWINEPTRVFVARHGRSELTSTMLTDAEVKDLVERMLRWSGRRLDVSSPFVDAMLPDGSRLHVVIPDVTRRHWAVNVRKHARHERPSHRSLWEAYNCSDLDFFVRGGVPDP
jgi:pilus assembly protein CpaF